MHRDTGTPLLGHCNLILLVLHTVLRLVHLEVGGSELVALLEGGNEDRAVIEQGEVHQSNASNHNEVEILGQTSRSHLAKGVENPETSPLLLILLILSKADHASNQTTEKSAEAEETALSSAKVEHHSEDGDNSHQNVANREGDLLLNLLNRL